MRGMFKVDEKGQPKSWPIVTLEKDAFDESPQYVKFNFENRTYKIPWHNVDLIEEFSE